MVEKESLLNKDTAVFSINLWDKIEDGNIVFFKGTIQNKTSYHQPITLKTLKFKGIRAVWFASKSLRANEKTTFIIAVAREL